MGGEMGRGKENSRLDYKRIHVDVSHRIYMYAQYPVVAVEILAEVVK